MIKFFIVSTVAALFVISAFAADHKDVMTTAQDFSLMGHDGQKHSLSDYDDAKAIVVMFIATKCPVSNGFNERMVEIADMYASKGVAFLGINSNKAEKLEEVKEHAKKHGFPFVVLKDDNNVIADQFKAKVTPEVYVLSSDKTVLYHGRIDDSADTNERKSADLVKALDEILAGKVVSASTTKAFGCTIKRVSM